MPGKKKGSEKTGGRKAGTPNKISKETRDVISDIIANNAERFGKAMEEIYVNDKPTYAALYIKLLPYVTPRLNSIDVTDNTQKDDSIEKRLMDMAEM